jgi:hypothetical protein
MKRIIALALVMLTIVLMTTACSGSFKTETHFLEGSRTTITMSSTDGYTFDMDGADIDFKCNRDIIARGTFYKDAYYNQNKVAVEAGYNKVEEVNDGDYSYAIYQCKSATATPQFMVLVSYDKTTHLLIKSDETLETVKTMMSCLAVE